MSYLWIGLGGAIGSIARAWLSLAIVRLTGPQFPWGTLLINVLGSFVIGGFSTLTMNDGRLPVPPDLRAFVIVGICGGFTTFSSFSLQTLELLRDGRPGQAVANMGLSLALCLMSVAAGHYGAVSLSRDRFVQARAPVEPMAGHARVLADLDRSAGAPRGLSAATQLLDLRNGGHLEALAVSPHAERPRLPIAGSSG